MEQILMIGIDLVKHGFQLHGAGPYGSVAFPKKLTRGKVLGFLASQPSCQIAMEAYLGTHHWDRQIGKPGYQVKSMPPVCVKAYVKRQSYQDTFLRY